VGVVFPGLAIPGNVSPSICSALATDALDPKLRQIKEDHRNRGNMKQWCTVLLMWLGMVALSLIGLSIPARGGCSQCGPAAVKPTGELRMLSLPGRQRMIPWAEVPSGGIKQPLLLIYDTLVACTDDGKILCRERHCGTLGRSG